MLRPNHRWIPSGFALLACLASADVNSGSDGRDGALTPASSVVIDLSDHPDGIFHYSAVTIPTGVTVSFAPNARNTSVVWLVQGKCEIAGEVDLRGASATDSGAGARGGPGGFPGGNGGSSPTAGQGPGGGLSSGKGGGNADNPSLGDSATYATAGWHYSPNGTPPAIYGNRYALPLLGGSGGGGGGGLGGGGGGGALLIAASEIVVDGAIRADGGNGISSGGFGNTSGAGSGGAVRLIATKISGRGTLSAAGGSFFASTYWGSYVNGSAGNGWVRIDCLDPQFGGSMSGEASLGFQPIILPAAGQGAQIAIESVAGLNIGTASGSQAIPDVVIPANQSNLVAIVVRCHGVPVNSEIIIEIRPTNSSATRIVALNGVGNLDSSTATATVQLPRGGGIIFARAVVGMASVAAAARHSGVKSLAQTGWTADGESFAQTELVSALGRRPQVVYLTSSGRRYLVPQS